MHYKEMYPTNTTLKPYDYTQIGYTFIGWKCENERINKYS